jgi:hypothetical protein
MKKLTSFLAVLMLSIGMLSANAQSVQTSTSASTKQVQRTKKDGTADKRYKSSQTSTAASVSAAPTKKDGTPDMRYKANKTTTTSAKKTVKPKK